MQLRAILDAALKVLTFIINVRGRHSTDTHGLEHSDERHGSTKLIESVTPKSIDKGHLQRHQIAQEDVMNIR
jgi:hypothetical protein